MCLLLWANRARRRWAKNSHLARGKRFSMFFHQALLGSILTPCSIHQNLILIPCSDPQRLRANLTRNPSLFWSISPLYRWRFSLTLYTSQGLVLPKKLHRRLGSSKKYHPLYDDPKHVLCLWCLFLRPPGYIYIRETSFPALFQFIDICFSSI